MEDLLERFCGKINLGVCLLISVWSLHLNANVNAVKPTSIDRGRYLVKIGGCNECHTPGYTAAEGKVPESQWLVGNPIGYRGAWGTSYAQNLRIHFQAMTLAEWFEHCRKATLEQPMPWWNLRSLSDADVTDIYNFVRSLGSAGDIMPETVPPEEEPEGQYYLMTPMGKSTKSLR